MTLRFVLPRCGLVVLSGCSADAGRAACELRGDAWTDGACEPQAADTDVADAPDTDLPDGFAAEVFDITPLPDPAILWVLDDSCSMVEEHFKVALAAPALFARLQNSEEDWHVGVITTDTSDSARNGKLVRVAGTPFIDRDVPQGAALFAEMSDPGSAGAITEQGLLAADRALRMPTRDLKTANAGFVAPGAAVLIVVVSDEDDNSAPQLTRNEFIESMRTLPGASSVSLFALVGPASGCESPDSVALPGMIYASVAKALDGAVYSLCDEDFTATVDAIGKRAMGPVSRYPLDTTPHLDTVTAWVVDGDGARHDGVRDAQRVGVETVAEVCARLRLSACFAYEMEDATVHLIDLDLPAPATLHVQYKPDPR